MDNQKTGALIAARRTELGLTQKQLAEQLHISDRTVSKWERGAGFPDIALLESVADALGLSVLELLRGEKLRQEEQISPASEHSMRDAFRMLSLRLKRFRRILIVSAGILGVLLLLWLLLLLSPFRTYKADNRAVSLAEAAALDPTSIITREDYDLLRRMSEDPELIALLREASGSEDYLEADAEITARYRELFLLDGRVPLFCSIQAFPFGDLSVAYRVENRAVMLTVEPDGTVRKHSVVYDGNVYESNSLPNSSSISNTDNCTFEYHGPRRLDRWGTLSMLLENLFLPSYRP